MNDSMKSKGLNTFPPELVAKLGMIPDAVIADLLKALNLNGQNFAMLAPDDLQVFDLFRKQERKYGVVASIESDADPEELAKANSQQQKDEILRRVNSTISVILI